MDSSWESIRYEIQTIANTQAEIEIDKRINELLKTINEKLNIDLESLIEVYHEFKSQTNSENGEIKKRRGRKKKTKEINIETSRYTYRNVTYLVDDKCNVYTYDIKNPLQIGQKLIDGTIKFFEGYPPKTNDN